jgi:hypothetical protein
VSPFDGVAVELDGFPAGVRMFDRYHSPGSRRDWRTGHDSGGLIVLQLEAGRVAGCHGADNRKSNSGADGAGDGVAIHGGNVVCRQIDRRVDRIRQDPSSGLGSTDRGRRERLHVRLDQGPGLLWRCQTARGVDRARIVGCFEMFVRQPVLPPG